MSRRRAYSPQTLAAMDRFFAALDECARLGLVKNTARFCAAAAIDSRHFYAQRNDRGRGYFELSWMLPLIDDCGVSPLWLIAGRGPMFAK